MATKLSQKDSKSFLAGGFFNNWIITNSSNKEEIGKELNYSFENQGVKVKIKWRETSSKIEREGFVIDITTNECLRVVEDGPNQLIHHIINPQQIIGVFFTTLGREIEINFGVGKSSVTSLMDE